MSLGHICVSLTCSISNLALIVVKFPQVTPSNMLLIIRRFGNDSVLYEVHTLKVFQFVKLRYTAVKIVRT